MGCKAGVMVWGFRLQGLGWFRVTWRSMGIFRVQGLGLKGFGSGV